MTTGDDLLPRTSSCFEHFGFDAFALDRLERGRPTVCPIATCTTAPINLRDSRGVRPFCSVHGLRIHSNTFVYWNGIEKENEARLRNFRIRPELAREIALQSGAKAESHRLGYEMSEDALTWNVLVGLAEAGRLRQALRFLTGRDVEAEPALYLWGQLIDVTTTRKRGPFQQLEMIRKRLENGIGRFKTEPDAMLVIEGQLLVCIEAKFASGNPLAREATVKAGEKPTDRATLLRRYLDQSGPETRRIIDRRGIGETFHSQLFRNVVFASEMADGHDWHVVNLVSSTQWARGRESKRYSFKSPEEHVRAFLHPSRKQSFCFRTWEDLHKALIKDDPALIVLDTYIRSKSAHYRRAFDLT